MNRNVDAKILYFQAILGPSAKPCLFNKASLNHTPKILSGNHHVDTIEAAVIPIVDMGMLTQVNQG